MTRKERKLIKGRLAEVQRKWERPVNKHRYTVYRHGKPAYQREAVAKEESWLLEVVLSVTLLIMAVYLILAI